jgi:ribosome-binding protein aMBF1 (putative translation factor)
MSTSTKTLSDETVNKLLQTLNIDPSAPDFERNLLATIDAKIVAVKNKLDSEKSDISFEGLAQEQAERENIVTVKTVEVTIVRKLPDGRDRCQNLTREKAQCKRPVTARCKITVDGARIPVCLVCYNLEQTRVDKELARKQKREKEIEDSKLNAKRKAREYLLDQEDDYRTAKKSKQARHR